MNNGTIITIYVPTKVEERTAVRSAINTVNLIVGGYTRYKAEGGWFNGTEMVTEPVAVYSYVVAWNASDGKHEAIAGALNSLEREMREAGEAEVLAHFVTTSQYTGPESGA